MHYITVSKEYDISSMLDIYYENNIMERFQSYYPRMNYENDVSTFLNVKVPILNKTHLYIWIWIYILLWNNLEISFNMYTKGSYSLKNFDSDIWEKRSKQLLNSYAMSCYEIKDEYQKEIFIVQWFDIWYKVFEELKEELKSDWDFILSLVWLINWLGGRNCMWWGGSKSVNTDISYLYWIDICLRNDKLFLMKLIKIDNSLYDICDESLKNNKVFIIELMENSRLRLQFLPDKYKNDKDIIAITKK